MRSFNQLQKRWDDHVSRGCYHPGIVIKDAGLVLGETRTRFWCPWARRGPARRLLRSQRIGSAF